mmetsp:Transcript_23160/g.41018  ORF Transcript_23160/g.41018 Transcript_23160/m.41018 type:complete len:140 (-) Transcript_23160:1666-2085(-)
MRNVSPPRRPRNASNSPPRRSSRDSNSTLSPLPERPLSPQQKTERSKDAHRDSVGAKADIDGRNGKSNNHSSHSSSNKGPLEGSKTGSTGLLQYGQLREEMDELRRAANARKYVFHFFYHNFINVTFCLKFYKCLYLFM